MVYVINDQLKTSLGWFKFFSANHSYSESYDKASIVSLLYKSKHILRQNSHSLVSGALYKRGFNFNSWEVGEDWIFFQKINIWGEADSINRMGGRGQEILNYKQAIYETYKLFG